MWRSLLLQLSVLLLAAGSSRSGSLRSLSRRPVRSLLIDNYDSYTWNLWQLVASINGAEPRVIYNDKYATWDELLKYEGDSFDNVILSPGPGDPTNPADFGVCMDAIKHSRLPLLGVCLGHQGLAHAFSGRVARAPEPMHGRLSPVSHDGIGLFKGVPQLTRVVRYHSLLAYDVATSPDLKETAWIDPATASGQRLTMGIQHRTRPLYGVQFHPESIATACGHALLTNFRDITLDALGGGSVSEAPAAMGQAKETGREDSGLICATESLAHHHSLGEYLDRAATSASADLPTRTQNAADTGTDFLLPPAAVTVLHVDMPPLNPSDTSTSASSITERLFEALYGSHAAAFWLDSAYHNDQAVSDEEGDGERGGLVKKRPLLSFMGALDGPGAFSAEYMGENEVVIRREGLESTSLEQNVFEFLSRHVDAPKREEEASSASADKLPFDTSGALFGFLGYEARHAAAHILTHSQGDDGRYNLSATRDGSFQGSRFSSEMRHPTALYLSPTRYVVADQDSRRVYIVSYAQSGEDKSLAEARAQELLEKVKQTMRTAPAHHSAEASAKSPPFSPSPKAEAGRKTTLSGGQSWLNYKDTIQRCLELIKAGETYEVCLTQQFFGKVDEGRGRLELYKTLRKRNPAPFACYLNYDPVKLGGHASIRPEADPTLGWYRPGGLTILCSSPERYISSRAGRLECKPIKGTIRRDLSDPHLDLAAAAKLREDEKSQAENLMIVDLVRNDLGRVSEVGSVKVPGLMKVETFASVHHLVSTVRGVLKPGLSIVDALIASFPGGSMTGAPKLRTMEIIDSLEQRPRGVYSGAIGYLTRSGDCDLNIAIRTAVIAGETISIASGGAVIALSDPQLEVEEARLKAHAVSKALNYALDESERESENVSESQVRKKPLTKLSSISGGRGA